MSSIYKTIAIFRDIDEEKFKELYLEHILPDVNNVPGVICTDITSVKSINPDVSGPLDGVQYIVETYFESLEQMSESLTSSRVKKHVSIAFQETPDQLSLSTGHTVRVYHDPSQEYFDIRANIVNPVKREAPKHPSIKRRMAKFR